jgi:hypothetical protein
MIAGAVVSCPSGMNSLVCLFLIIVSAVYSAVVMIMSFIINAWLWEMISSE